MKDEMRLELWPIEKLKNWELNPRGIEKVDFEDLKHQIKELKVYKPLVVTEDGVVLGGNMRTRAYKDLGFTELYVSIVDAPTEELKLKYAISDNDNKGYYEQDKLAEIAAHVEEQLKHYAVNLGKLHSVSEIIDKFRPTNEDDFDAEAEYDAIVTPVSVLGDVYQLGDHRLMNGDSANPEHWQKLMQGEKGRLVFTDPPYNVDYVSPSGFSYDSAKYGGSSETRFNDNKTDVDAQVFYTKVLECLKTITTDDAPIYWWFANSNYTLNYNAFSAAGYKMSQVIIWLKNNMVFSRGQDYHRIYEPCMFGWKEGQTHFTNNAINDLKDVFNVDFTDFNEMLDVWYERKDSVNTYIHPTQKPVRLAERGIKKSSEPGDIVIDAFSGSASTLIGCELLHRRCRAIELDPKFVDVGIKRWEKLTGEKAVKL